LSTRSELFASPERTPERVNVSLSLSLSNQRRLTSRKSQVNNLDNERTFIDFESKKKPDSFSAAFTELFVEKKKKKRKQLTRDIKSST
jgi:hypothetical protein